MPVIFSAIKKKKPKVKSGMGQDTVIAREPQTKNPLAAFVVRPGKIKFETQERREKILLLLRRHLITQVGWVLVAIGGLIMPALLVPLPVWDMVPERFMLVGAVVWYLLVVGYVFESFLTWYFNVFIVTDERIIDIDFYSMLYKRISAAKIDQIQDVSFSQGGVFGAMLDYGTLDIQTAGKVNEFEISNVPHPRKVAMFMNEMLLEEEKERREGRAR